MIVGKIHWLSTEEENTCPVFEEKSHKNKVRDCLPKTGAICLSAVIKLCFMFSYTPTAKKHVAASIKASLFKQMIKEIHPSLEKIPLLALYFSSACENYISYFSEICKIFQKMGLLHEYWPWKIMFSNLAPRYNKLWFISIFEAVTWGHIWNSSDLYCYQNIHLHTFSNLPNKIFVKVIYHSKKEAYS